MGKWKEALKNALQEFCDVMIMLYAAFCSRGASIYNLKFSPFFFGLKLLSHLIIVLLWYVNSIDIHKVFLRT